MSVAKVAVVWRVFVHSYTHTGLSLLYNLKLRQRLLAVGQGLPPVARRKAGRALHNVDAAAGRLVDPPLTVRGIAVDVRAILVLEPRQRLIAKFGPRHLDANRCLQTLPKPCRILFTSR